ncbi:hypothetical protein RJ641_036164 [Dillenia turbinata]|uniref:Uncharacterized protein n=1 Tax=Dillenia turbinata TaxID=194707 RepID=A0AAN8ZG29_9MAGN
MATVPSSPLQFPSFPSTTSSSRATLLTKPHAPPLHLFFATDPETTTSSQTAPDEQPNPQPEQDAFENRLSQVRLRYRSGTGKKAEIRKIRSGKKPSSSSTSSVFLPPVQLKEPISNGLKVETGFTPYTEWLNGRHAILGLAALLSVELATGKSLINYHSPAIVLIQIYFVAAVGALCVKFEKERVSVWPLPKK